MCRRRISCRCRDREISQCEQLCDWVSKKLTDLGIIKNLADKLAANAAYIEQNCYTVAEKFTHNASSNTVVLGKLIEHSEMSYEQVGMINGWTYWFTENWSQFVNAVGQANAWVINNAFIINQYMQGKTFILTSNPHAATGAFAQEVGILETLGYIFVPRGAFWVAVGGI